MEYIPLELLDSSSEEWSMDNPVIAYFPYLSIGGIFTYKGDRCVVERLSKNKKGFWYRIQGTQKTGYMSFYYFLTTPYGQWVRNARVF